MTVFARCTRCNRICGVMRASDARFGGWLEVLDRTCICGASAEGLVPATQNEAERVVGRAELAVVLVSDDWPGS